MFKLEFIKEEFRLPISYCNEKMEINSSIKNDLELVECVDSSANSIYAHIFNPTNTFGDVIMKEMPKYYTTNKDFLTDTQTILKNVEPIHLQEGLTLIKYGKKLKMIADSKKNTCIWTGIFCYF